jgi:hypothetical protein
MDWQGRFLTDAHGNALYEAVEIEIDEPVLNKETSQLEMKKVLRKMTRRIQNPDYDPNSVYVPRTERAEWVPVGLLGQLTVYDDGLCQVNGYCQPSDGGIATSTVSGYRVMERINGNLIRILLK